MSDQVFTRADWERLREMREHFLTAEDGAPREPYWNSLRDFELYDATFARRIAWKFDAVLDELIARGRMPRATRVFDWGCGTGVASRAVVAKLPGVERVELWDRTRDASEFAREHLLAERPGLEVDIVSPGDATEPELLCISHVLDELTPGDLDELRALAHRSRAVIWVEPGSRGSSRRLVELREQLRGEFDVLAPCTHNVACGLRESATDWCHHFTRPPPEVFTTSFWRRFAEEVGIDMRSVPYAFLVLARQELRAADGAVARILGRPRIMKGRALLDVCDESGVRNLAFLERMDKQLFKRLDRGRHEPLLAELSVDERRITAIRERSS